MTAYGPDPIGSYLAQVDDLDAEEELRAVPAGRPEIFYLIDHCQKILRARARDRQDAYDDLRARCRMFDLIYHVTGGRPVSTQPVTHRRTT